MHKYYILYIILRNIHQLSILKTVIYLMQIKYHHFSIKTWRKITKMIIYIGLYQYY